MKLLIEVTEEYFNYVKQRVEENKNEARHLPLEYIAIANGVPIPDNATNGDVIKTIIKALFPNMELADNFGFWVNLIDEGGHGVGDFYALWLNAPYKGVDKNGKERI